ncbi:MAG: glycosyltransferase family 4 protein, partial [Verrucomicrobia bacterium]|nr:glycosyltransferase family 4 protein [Verrucomicrobiota bacterium]
GHEVHIVTARDDRVGLNRFPNLPAEEVVNGVRVHRVPSVKIRYLQTLSLIGPMTRKALELHAQRPFDLIHAHIFPALAAGARIERATRLPLLVTVQGIDLAYFPGSPVTNATVKWFTRPALPRASLVQAVCQSLAERARRLGAREVVVVPNGVDTAKFEPGDRATLRRQLGCETNDKLIVCAARLSREKCHEVLLRSVVELCRRRLPVRLLLIGTGPLRNQLQRRVRELGLEAHVEFLGYQPHEKLAQYLAAGDVFVLTSLAEGLPVSILEAMACGTAVVASNVDGTPDIITDGQNGFLVPPRDVAALTARLEQTLSDDALRARLADAGLRRIRERFCWETILQEMETIYARFAPPAGF